MADTIKDYRDYLVKEKIAAAKAFLEARREAAHVIESMSVENSGERLIIQMSGIEKMAAASERWAAADKALDIGPGYRPWICMICSSSPRAGRTSETERRWKHEEQRRNHRCHRKMVSGWLLRGRGHGG